MKFISLSWKNWHLVRFPCVKEEIVVFNWSAQRLGNVTKANSKAFLTFLEYKFSHLLDLLLSPHSRAAADRETSSLLVSPCRQYNGLVVPWRTHLLNTFMFMSRVPCPLRRQKSTLLNPNSRVCPTWSELPVKHTQLQWWHTRQLLLSFLHKNFPRLNANLLRV